MSPARALLAVALCSGCATTPIRGVVFADRNGDGIRQENEPGVPNAVVAFERSTFAVTDANGLYHLEAPLDHGRVWVRIPDGYRPGPLSRPIAREAIDLPLSPLSEDEVASPLTFVVASDSHIPNPGNDGGKWDGGDLIDAIDQAVSLASPPRFFTIVGDMTAGNESYQFDVLENAVRTVGMPWIPVAGNHDWYDGGANFRRYYGVDNYSFDVGNVHFIVWDTNLGVDDQIAFLTADLAHVAGGMTVVAMAHHSPLDEVADAMDDLGVDYMLTGHWHANRRVQRGDIVELSTQTFVMGAIDQSASGYRIVTFSEDGEMHVEHRERMVRNQLDLVSPHPGTCVADGAPIIAAAALDASTPEVTVRVDCGPEQALSPAGGWSFHGSVGALAPGTHSLTLSAVSAGGRREEKQVAIEVCAPSGELANATEWTQLGGTSEHTNARGTPVAPPLVARWIANVGGTISLGTPIVAGGLAIVVVLDNAGGDRGGLVALDLATGAERWRYRTPFPAVGAAAASGDTVVVATKNGEVHAVALADGTPRWQHDAAAGISTFSGSLWGPPTIADGLVYVALQGNFTALDLASGTPVWARDPDDPEFNWLGSLAAVAVSEGTAIAAFNRTLGVASASATTGAAGWSIKDGRSVAVNASPVIENGIVYLVSAAGAVSAATLDTGSTIWARNVTPGANEWHYSVTATPALAGGRLFVATQWDDLVALDAASGAELWRVPAADGVLSFTHYRDAQAAWAASPVVTGDIVWIGGLDGRLRALATDDGRELWSTQLGAPITSAVAPTGDSLVVASYDGSVRLLTPGTPAAPAAVSECPPLPPTPPAQTTPGGCAIASPSSAALVLLAVLVSFGMRSRRRSTR